MPVVIPTHESAFQEHVQAAGCVTINLRIIKVNGSFKIVNNTDEVQLSVPAEDVDELVAALRSAEKLLG